MYLWYFRMMLEDQVEQDNIPFAKYKKVQVSHTD